MDAHQNKGQTRDVSTAARPHSHRRSAFVMATLVAAALCGQSGCVASKYRLAKSSTPPVQPLNIAFPPSTPLQAALTALISFGGPGSWKREALWDEYVITLQNDGAQPLTIYSATLADSAGIAYTAGHDPWALEKQSKMLETQYRDRGEAFLRSAGPGVAIVGVGAAAAAATIAGPALIAPAAAGALAALAVLPVYYLSVWGIDYHNKQAVMAEFTRRRLALPLTLAPGETRTASLFYPMVRNPRSLELYWSSESSSRQAALPLDFLKGLHVPAAPADTTSKKPSTP